MTRAKALYTAVVVVFSCSSAVSEGEAVMLSLGDPEKLGAVSASSIVDGMGAWFTADPGSLTRWRGRERSGDFSVPGTGYSKPRVLADGSVWDAQWRISPAGVVTRIAGFEDAIRSHGDPSAPERYDEAWKVSTAEVRPDGSRALVAASFAPPRGRGPSPPEPEIGDQLVWVSSDGQYVEQVASFVAGGPTDVAVSGTHAAWSADGLWLAQNGASAAKVDADLFGRKLAFSADGNWLLSAGVRGRLTVVDVSQAQVAFEPAESELWQAVAAHPDVPLFIVGSAAGTLIAVCVNERKVERIQLGGPISALGFVDGGVFLAAVVGQPRELRRYPVAQVSCSRQ